MRFYFYTLTGKEIETSLSDLKMEGTGAALATVMYGQWQKVRTKTIKGLVIARDTISVYEGNKIREITIDDFPEHTAVLVYNWYPDAYLQEWFILRKRLKNEFYACDVPLGKPAVISSFDGYECIIEKFIGVDCDNRTVFLSSNGDYEYLDRYTVKRK